MTNFGGPNPVGGGHQPAPQNPHTAQPHGTPHQGPPPGWQQTPPPTGAAPYPAPPPGQHSHLPYPPPDYALPPQIAPRPPRGRRRLILTAAGAAIAVILVVAGIVVVTSSSDSGPASAGDTVQAYLEALARGDSDTALSFGLTAPPDKTFLTDDILKKQIEKSPISGIRIVESTDTGMVHVFANFGDAAVDETLYLKRDGDGGAWKLESAALPLDFKKDNASTGAGLIDAVTIFGEPIPASGRPYVFPGPVEYGTSNPNFTVTIDNPTYLLNNIPWGVNLNYRFDITDAGKDAVKKAMMPVIVECTKSTELSPPNCPQDAGILPDRVGTATWIPPSTLDDITFVSFIGDDGRQTVTGTIDFGGTLQTNKPAVDKYSELRYSFRGYADMTEQPPVFTFYTG